MGKKLASVPVLVLVLLVAQTVVVKGMDEIVAAVAAGVGGSLALVGLSGLKVVGTGDALLIERLGKYNRLLGPGLHWTIPLLETVSMRETLREQILDVPPQRCYTKDNAPINADAVVYLRIYDLEAARYRVAELSTAILNLVLTQLREEMGKLTLDETFSSRDILSQALLRDCNAVTTGWGVELTRVEVKDIYPTADILTAMESQSEPAPSPSLQDQGP